MSTSTQLQVKGLRGDKRGITSLMRTATMCQECASRRDVTSASTRPSPLLLDWLTYYPWQTSPERVPRLVVNVYSDEFMVMSMTDRAK
jgi:hypothetical protein